jgi:hypothetical protein
MIAAIYARKSTEQNGADADAKSIARWIHNARYVAEAARKDQLKTGSTAAEKGGA